MNQNDNNIFRLLVLCVLIFVNTVLHGQQVTDADDIIKPTTYQEMETFLNKVSERSFISLSVEGQTVEDRNIYLVRVYRGTKTSKWRLFFFAQQHGNEPAGKDGLLRLLGEIAETPELLPKDVELWMIPMVNPDGAEADKRRNGNNFDLNRDHQILHQPETQTIHRLARQIMPHISVDCHEFTRDSEDYTSRGWHEWPLIMMDCTNSPIFGNALLAAGERWIENARKVMESAGINYTRYFVGGAPPEGELRFSTTEMDDARNGVGAYGGLSFIIESGVKRSTATANSDLPDRVNAYTSLLKYLIASTTTNQADINLIDGIREKSLPQFLPTNYFWGNHGFQINQVPVIDTLSQNVINIPTANFVQDLIVKKTIAAPVAYIIDSKNASVFSSFLDRHSIQYKIIPERQEFIVEACQMIRIEKEWDDLYSRYENRQVVELQDAQKLIFPPGSVMVSLDKPDARRAALHLEPTMLYGLYQYPEFRALIDDNGIIPVARVLESY